MKLYKITCDYKSMFIFNKRDTHIVIARNVKEACTVVLETYGNRKVKLRPNLIVAKRSKIVMKG